jgi:alcohol dehydrogenase class IV
MLPYVLAHNRPAIEAKIARLAAWLGIGGGFDGFQAALLDLRKRTGVPHTVRELGIDNFLDDKIAMMALDDPSTGGNPVAFDISASLLLFNAAYKGDFGAIPQRDKLA